MRNRKPKTIGKVWGQALTPVLISYHVTWQAESERQKGKAQPRFPRLITAIEIANTCGERPPNPLPKTMFSLNHLGIQPAEAKCSSSVYGQRMQYDSRAFS